MFLRWKKKAVSRVVGYMRNEDCYAGCNHGVAATRLIPELLQSYRADDGKSKHRRLWAGIAFRTCCLELPHWRVTWWQYVVTSLEAIPESVVTTKDRARILAEISRTIPRATAHEIDVYQNGFVGFSFGIRPRESWGDQELRHWAEAVENRRLRKPRPQWQTFTINFGPDTSKQIPDACKVLGLRPGYTAGELKEAWRAAAKLHHPDRGGSEAAFRKAKAAYDLLASQGNP